MSAVMVLIIQCISLVAVPVSVALTKEGQYTHYYKRDENQKGKNIENVVDIDERRSNTIISLTRSVVPMRESTSETLDAELLDADSFSWGPMAYAHAKPK